MLQTINWKLPAQKKRIFPAIGSTTRVHLYTIVRRWNARNSLDKTYSLLIKGKGKWITLNRLWSSLSNIKENKKKTADYFFKQLIERQTGSVQTFCGWKQELTALHTPNFFEWRTPQRDFVLTILIITYDYRYLSFRSREILLYLYYEWY